MAKGRGRVRVETSGESARTYDVRRGEEVTVRTKRERPEVTGGGGGGGGGGDFNPLGCLFGIIIILVIIYKAVDYSVNMVEVKVIKKIAPTYVTRHEAAEEEKEKGRKEKEEKKKTEEEKRKNIENSITKKLKIKSVYNFGREPEILPFSDKEIYAIVYLEKHGEVILTRTTDGGGSWKTVLSSNKNQYFGRLSVGLVNGKKIITVYLDFTHAICTKSEDDGKTWKFFNSQGEEISRPPMENNRILVHLPNY